MPCSFCGKEDAPVRQVPAPMPVSDCYCDDCYDECAKHYQKSMPKSRMYRQAPPLPKIPVSDQHSLEVRTANASAVLHDMGSTTDGISDSISVTPVYSANGEHLYDKVTVSIGFDLADERNDEFDVTVDDNGAVVNNQGNPVSQGWYPGPNVASTQPMQEPAPQPPNDKTRSTYDAWKKARGLRDAWRE